MITKSLFNNYLANGRVPSGRYVNVSSQMKSTMKALKIDDHPSFEMPSTIPGTGIPITIKVLGLRNLEKIDLFLWCKELRFLIEQLQLDLTQSFSLLKYILSPNLQQSIRNCKDFEDAIRTLFKLRYPIENLRSVRNNFLKLVRMILYIYKISGIKLKVLHRNYP